jgi:hypothetical protein
MGKLLAQIGSVLVLSRRHRSVRTGFIGICTNLFIASAIIFSLEVVLIMLGAGDIFIPLTNTARSFISKLVF